MSVPFSGVEATWKSGDADGAISKYLLLRAPEEAAAAFLNVPTINEALHEIADPALANIVREAVWFCWEQGRWKTFPDTGAPEIHAGLHCWPNPIADGCHR